MPPIRWTCRCRSCAACKSQPLTQYQIGHHVYEVRAAVAGLNVNGEQLRHQDGSSALPAGRYTYATVCDFVQDDWQPAAQLTVQAGLRLDHHNQYGNFLVPRLALLYRFSASVTSPLNGGLGYRMPVPFVNELDERDYSQI